MRSVVVRFIRLGILSLLLLPHAGWAVERNQQWEETFFRANQAYKQGRFHEAAEGYRRLISSGLASGHVYYNLGNCYVRLGQLGKAILSYERARILVPRDPDLDFNLRYARDQIQDILPQSGSFLSMIFFWLKSLNGSELFWGFAALNCLFWGVLTMRVFVRPEWSYYLFLLLLVFWLIAGGSLALKWYQTSTDERAVILAHEIKVFAGPDTEDTLLFKLHEGSVVYAERWEDGWSLIRLPDGKRGWVRAEAMGRIVGEKGFQPEAVL